MHLVDNRKLGNFETENNKNYESFVSNIYDLLLYIFDSSNNDDLFTFDKKLCDSENGESVI